MNVPRLLRWLLIPTAIALGLSVLLSIWLVRSDGGRDWLLARVIGVLPAEATLRWDQIEGTLSGPLEIHGIHFDYTAPASMPDACAWTTAFGRCCRVGWISIR